MDARILSSSIPPSHAAAHPQSLPLGDEDVGTSKRDQGCLLTPLQPAPYWSPVTMASEARCAQTHGEANDTSRSASASTLATGLLVCDIW